MRRAKASCSPIRNSSSDSWVKNWYWPTKSSHLTPPDSGPPRHTRLAEPNPPTTSSTCATISNPFSGTSSRRLQPCPPKSPCAQARNTKKPIGRSQEPRLVDGGLQHPRLVPDRGGRRVNVIRIPGRPHACCDRIRGGNPWHTARIL